MVLGFTGVSLEGGSLAGACLGRACFGGACFAALIFGLGSFLRVTVFDFCTAGGITSLGPSGFSIFGRVVCEGWGWGVVWTGGVFASGDSGCSDTADVGPASFTASIELSSPGRAGFGIALGSGFGFGVLGEASIGTGSVFGVEVGGGLIDSGEASALTAWEG